jgi:hypothetical protein
MAKRKTLLDNFQEIIDSGDFQAFTNVFEKCEITATDRGKTTCNALSYRSLTPKHIQFLVDRGLDVNADCGFGKPAIDFHASNKESIDCLIKNGADVNLVSGFLGTPLARACFSNKAQAVKNLLEVGASVKIAEECIGISLLDETLRPCSNIAIIDVLEISRMLIAQGCKSTDKTKMLVREIGERFEFYREEFNPSSVNEYSDALNELYKLYDVEPVSRIIKHDGKSAIAVKGKIWQEQYNELWKMLVPASGSAETVQGEMIRVVGMISHEILDNGGLNWDNRHKQLLSSLSKLLNPNMGWDKKLVAEATGIIGKITPSTSKATIDRLVEIIVKSVVGNPKPIKLTDIESLQKKDSSKGLISRIKSLFK